MSGLVGIDRPEPLLEKPGERVINVDDLVEPRTEEIVLPAIPEVKGFYSPLAPANTAWCLFVLTPHIIILDFYK
jgi:hypothetical protein